MIDCTSTNNNCSTWSKASPPATAPVATCYVPWVFMEFRDLFGDGTSDGDFQRTGCLHEAHPDGSCPSCPSLQSSTCSRAVPCRHVVAIAAGSSRLPRDEIRATLEAGDEICLEFPMEESPTDTILTETAHLMRKLRNTGICVTVSGLSTADKSKLSRLEWRTV